MKKWKLLISLLITFFSSISMAQDLSFSKPGKTFYTEMANPSRPNLSDWAKLTKPVMVSFADDNIRYAKEKVPSQGISQTWAPIAWKGEKIHTQILVWTNKNIPSVSFKVSSLKNEKGNTIDIKNIKPAFVRYVMADYFVDGCSQKKPNTHDSLLVEDPIDIINTIPVEANSVRPLWLSIEVPANISAGNYTGSVIINAEKEYELKIFLKVLNHILPPASEWKYDFDLWQYPDPIAKIHNVKLWSAEHFELMRQYFTVLANAGQKVITANIIEQPWGLDHVQFKDPSLIAWTKKKDGTWTWDYSLFDKYIPFVMKCGITQRINCYSMITWDLSFIYFDEASGKNVSITLTPGSVDYTNYWKPMIIDFTSHLKEKGWFDKTAIAMDERPLESMKAVISLLREVDPGWKIALAGDTYHPEIEMDIYDHCLASYLKFDPVLMEKRKALGMPTTYYTACPEKYPNGHTSSPPAENAWLGWHAAAKGYTGYLFWAYNTWVIDPLHDSRWRRYPAGDLFEFYPGPRTSIRFEKLIEGIQDFEKIRLLKEQLLKYGNEEGMKILNNVLSEFEIGKLDSVPAAEMLIKAKTILNKF
jgi:hypothetical protein